MKRALVWFRNDLRVHDNEALLDAIQASEEIIPLYVFDDRIFKGKTKFGFEKTGPHRAKFVIESIKDLRNSFESKNSKFYVRSGKPEEIIPQICREFKVSWVYCNRERTSEEVKVQDELESHLWSIGVEMRYSRGKMLYHTADLPFPITQTPTIFTSYRKEVEKIVKVREPLSISAEFTQLSEDLEQGEIPTLADFGKSEKIVTKGLELKGGETAGLALIQEYFHETESILHYKQTRNGLLGKNYSSKFSAYLSQGCLSPKMIYHELKLVEEKHGAQESTYHMFFELLWRDFFRLMAKKYGNDIFKFEGICHTAPKEDSTDRSLFNIWKEGRTGIPFVDANMKELEHTGFMSNRGRQNVASFLIYDMGINWLLGAEYFESMLIDYDPCSNYGNWSYIAGVGTDPKNGRHFNVAFQSHKFDPEAKFIKYWLPELEKVPSTLLTNKYLDHLDELADYQVILGKTYPAPVVQNSID